MPEENSSKNDQNQILQVLAATGDKWVKLGTLALIAITGVGNLVTTIVSNVHVAQVSKEVSREETDRALKEIHALYTELDDTIRRQKDIRDRVLELQTEERNKNLPKKEP